MYKLRKREIISILAGTILEWYDFSLFGAMAPIIAKLFFPEESAVTSLLLTFSIFASGFLMRPIGAIIFGHIGDKYGRRPALSLTIIFMALPTTLIGVLPAWQSVGLLAPILLVILRLAQGMAASGEYPGAICFLTEISKTNNRGFFGSISVFGVVGGVFLGAMVNAVLSYFLTNMEIYAWGWRIPFLIGLPLGAIGWYLRYRLSESRIYTMAASETQELKAPFKEVMKHNFAGLVSITILFALPTVCFYMGFVYITTYLVSIHMITLHQALINNALSMVAYTIFIPTFGYLSDKINRKYMMLLGAIGLFAFLYPIFLLFLSGQNHLVLLGQILLALLIGVFVGPLAAISSESFSTLTRYSGIATGLNIGASIFGGTCPLVATYLIEVSGHGITPVFYPITLSIISFFIIITLKINQEKSLNEISNN